PAAIASPGSHSRQDSRLNEIAVCTTTTSPAADNRVPHLLCALDGCRHVRRQHESLTNEVFCGSRDLPEGIFTSGITLLDRTPGITCFLPVCSRKRERVEAADQSREVLQIGQLW